VGLFVALDELWSKESTPCRDDHKKENALETDWESRPSVFCRYCLSNGQGSLAYAWILKHLYTVRRTLLEVES